MKLSSSLSFAAALVLAGSGCSLIVDGALTGGGGPPPSSCDGLDDGTPCERAGITVPLVCISGTCTNSRCGDGVRDARAKADGSVEECDDGNPLGGDGCEPDCTATVGCTTADDCVVPEIECVVGACNGGECALESAPDDTPCIDVDGQDGLCFSGFCLSAGCGDGVVDPDELCDDGNLEYGDGCTRECKPDCTSSTECSQDPCFGIQHCEPSADSRGVTGLCVTDTPALSCDPTCEVCDSALGMCAPSPSVDMDADRYASAASGCGADCDDANAGVYPDQPETCGDGVDINCNGDGDESAMTTWYADCDGDGFAASDAPALTDCAPPPPPALCPEGTWTSLAPTDATVTDCLDSNPDVSPGQTRFFYTGYAVGMTTSFDYNCSMYPEREYRSVRMPLDEPCGSRCSDPPVIAGGLCGETATLYECETIRLGVCGRVPNPRAVTIRCR